MQFKIEIKFKPEDTLMIYFEREDYALAEALADRLGATYSNQVLDKELDAYYLRLHQFDDKHAEWVMMFDDFNGMFTMDDMRVEPLIRV